MSVRPTPVHMEVVVPICTIHTLVNALINGRLAEIVLYIDNTIIIFDVDAISKTIPNIGSAI